MAAGDGTADVVYETPGPPYRIQLVHDDAEHPNSEPAHWGPAYDAGYASVLADAGLPTDLLAAARNGLARCLAENPAEQGYTAVIVALVNDAWVEVV